MIDLDALALTSRADNEMILASIGGQEVFREFMGRQHGKQTCRIEMAAIGECDKRLQVSLPPAGLASGPSHPLIPADIPEEVS